MRNGEASFVLLGDALLDMMLMLMLMLNATDNQLADWSPTLFPCSWSHIICDKNNSVVQV